MKIIYDLSPETDFINDYTIKDLIVIHGTAGLNYPGIDATLDIKDRINVHYVILRDGTLVQRMPENAWAYHTGNKASSIRSIGIECETWVNAVKKGDRYFNVGYSSQTEIPAAEIIRLKKFRGYEYYHILTDLQKDTLAELIVRLASRHPIPLIWTRDVKDYNFYIKGITTHACLSVNRLDYPSDYPLVNNS